MTAIAIESLDRARKEIDDLAGAAIGLIERATAARFKINQNEIYMAPRWPRPEAMARATVIYILHTNLKYTVEAAGGHFFVSERVASRSITRIADLRDDDAGFEFWISELSHAMRSK